MVRRRAPQLGLTPAVVAEAYRRARGRLLAFQTADDDGAEALWTDLRLTLAAAPDALSPDALLQRFFGAAVALSAHAVAPSLAKGEARDLGEVMEAVLRLVGGERGDVATAYLHVAHQEALASVATADGRPEDAAWRHLAAYQAGQPIAAELDAAFFASFGARLLRAGLLGAATQALAAADVAPGAGADVTRAGVALQRAEHAVLEGQAETGDAPLASVGLVLGEARLTHARAVLTAARGDFGPLAAAVRRHGQTLGPEELLASCLWLRAARQRDLLLRAPSLPAVARRHRARISAQPALKALQEVTAAVVEMYDTERPLSLRGEALLTALARRGRLPSLVQELLALAAAARALARHSQHALLPAVVEPYRALSLSLTDGASGDALAIVEDLLDYRLLTVRTGDEPLEELDKGEVTGDVPTGAARVAALSSLAGKAGVRIAVSKLRLALAGKERAEAVRARNAQRFAAALSEEMRGLRGVVQKIGQTLSFAATLLPDEARAVLGALYTTSTPLSPAAVKSVVERSLGRDLADAFTEWTPAPLAAGSIGQVHAATTQTGQRVAVKVQYPGVAEAIRGDFRSANVIGRVVKRALPHANVDEILAEVERVLVAECDYHLEAANQEQMRGLVADLDGGVVIPRVYPELSSAGVLTSDFLVGEGFDAFCAVASAAERDRIGELLFTFVMRSALRDGLFYGDPQPGNFLIMPDARGVQLGVVDFGCVGHWDAPTRQVIADFYRGFLEPGTVDLAALLLRSGFVADPARFDYEAEYARQRGGLMRPFLEPGPFTFTDAFIHDVARTAVKENKNLKAGAMPANMILTPRLIWGLYYLLGRLGATSDWRARLLGVLAEMGQAPAARSA